MEDRAHAIAAGLFALLLGTALVFTLWWFSDKRDVTRDVVLVSAGSVNGLNPQATVRYRGIMAGKVASIALDPARPQDLLVTARIRADLPLTRGTRARLATQGVTGIAFIAIDDSGADPTPLAADGNGPPRIALEPGLVEEVADATRRTLGQLRELSERFARLASNENIGRVERILAHMESSSKGLDKGMQDAAASLAAVHRMLGKDNLARIERTLANAERFSSDAAPLGADGRRLLARMQDVADRLDVIAASTGEGFATSTLPRLNVLLQELTTTSRQMNDLLDELDSHPQIFLLGRGKAPPGPGEAGFVPNRP